MSGRWIARWFGKRTKHGDDGPGAQPPQPLGEGAGYAPAGQASPEANLCLRHWQSLQADGIAASRFIEYLQPLADLEAVSVYDLEVTEVAGTPTVYGMPGRSR